MGPPNRNRIPNMGLTSDQKAIVKRIVDKELEIVPVSGSTSPCWTHFYKVRDPQTNDYLEYIYAPDCGTLYSFKSGGTSTANKHVQKQKCSFYIGRFLIRKSANRKLTELNRKPKINRAVHITIISVRKSANRTVNRTEN